MKTCSNEQLCALAQKGDKVASGLLLNNNLGFIRKTAFEMYRSINQDESELGIEKDDLEQEGSIGLLDAIPRFDGSKGIKFLTYAAPSIRNAMTDLIRTARAQYEQRMTDTKDGLGFQKSGWMMSFPIKNGCCELRRLPILSPNPRSRFISSRRPCASCMKDCGASQNGNRFICSIVLALRTIWSTLWWEQLCTFISVRAGRGQQKHWHWTTSGWNCRGGISAFLWIGNGVFDIPLLPFPDRPILLLGKS